MQGIVAEDSEMSYLRGYEHGAIEIFQSVERFLDPATRQALRAWIEKDVYAWRMSAMLSNPPVWRLRMLAGRGPAPGPAFFP